MESLENLQKLTKKWLKTEQIDENEEILDIIKVLHDQMMENTQIIKEKSEKLLIENMDADQVWEQINLHIEPIEKFSQSYIKKIPNFKAQKKQKKIKSEVEKILDSQSSEIMQDEENEMDVDDLNSEKEVIGSLQIGSLQEINDMEQEQEQEQDNQVQEQGSQQDNQSQEDLERFLDQADEQDAKMMEKGYLESGNSKDLSDSDEMGSQYEQISDEKEIKGKDFFKTQKIKNNLQLDSESEQDSHDQEAGEDDDDIENEVFDEQREKELEIEQEEDKKSEGSDEITRIEKRLLGEKDWQLKGEVRSRDRPLNSLVEQDLDFMKNTKQIEPINEEYQENLETIIKQRILDELFDDRQKQVITNQIKENFSGFQVSQQKDDKGLSELYEEDFKNLLNLPTADKDEKLKFEIKNLFQNLCYKLDQLSNLSYTPKPLIQMAEIKCKNIIQNNNNIASTPAVDFDEKLPIHISQNQQDAKSTLKDQKPVFRSKEEMNPNENKQERAKKKSAMRQKKKAIEKKKSLKQLQYKGQTKQELKNPINIKKQQKTMQTQKNVQSIKFSKSNDFFKNLQENIEGKNKPQKEIVKKQQNFKL